MTLLDPDPTSAVEPDAELPRLYEVNADNHQQVVTYLDQLAQESVDGRAPWLSLADACKTIYEWGQYPQPNDVLNGPMSNDIQDAVHAITDKQTREPPTATITPTETGDPGEVYDLTSGMQIPPEMVGQVRAQMQMEAQAGVQSQFNLMTVDDKMTADVYQKVFNFYWREAQTDQFNRDFVLWTNAIGWRGSLYEWDHEEKRHSFTDISIRQLYFDPSKPNVRKSAYVGIDLVMDANEAKAMYPSLAKRIDRFAKTGDPDRPSEATSFGAAVDRQFSRKTVTLRIFWLRNQPVAMEPDEALSKGLVEIRPAPVESEDASEQSHQDADAGIPSSEDPNPVGESPDEEDVSNGEILPAQPLAAPTRQAFYLAGTDTEVTPPVREQKNDPNWPTKRVVRQITVLAKAVVRDQPNPYWDIPILHSVCIPIENSPFGQGMPFKLKRMQEKDNSVLESLGDYVEYIPHPAVVLPESTAAKLGKSATDWHLKPNRVYIVPDAMMDKPLQLVIPPPPMNQALPLVHDIFEKKLDRSSADTEISRGIAPSAQASGKLVEMLKGEQESRATFSAQWTKDMVYHESRLMLHSLVWRLEPEDIAEICSKYPIFIIAAIVERARRRSRLFDMEVLIPGGNGITLYRKHQEALAKFQVQDPNSGETVISMETLRQELGVDHQQETERNKEVLQQAAMRQAMQAEHESGLKVQEKQAGKNGNGRF